MNLTALAPPAAVILLMMSPVYDNVSDPRTAVVEQAERVLQADCDVGDPEACTMAQLLRECLAGDTDFCYDGRYWKGGD